MSDARPVPNTSAARAVYARPGGVRRAGLVIDNAPGITRIVAVVASKSDAHHLSFGLEGFTPHVQEDGQALFVASDGVFIPVAAPWAKDARGRDLKTYFQTNGQDLVQVVSPSPDTVYPIVADPQMVWYAGGWGAKFSRSETSNMRDWSVAAGMCAGLLLWPGAAGVCGAWVSYAVFQATLAEQDNPKTCLFAVVVPAIGSIWRVRC